MHRRHYLLGVGVGAGLFDVPVTRLREDGDLSVEIRETNDPVEAGDPLEGVVAVENRGGEAVRPSVNVRFGGDEWFTWEVTVEPGETVTRDLFRPTFPVRTDVEVPIRVESEYGSDERLVEVLGIDELEAIRVSPDRETVAVQPGTTVLFEADGWGQWWSGGQQVFDGLVPIWEQPYFEETGALYWRNTFEKLGDHEVIAVVDRDGTNHRVTWSVEVTHEGAQAPRVNEVTPAGETAELTHEETATFELEVTDTDADLYRAVWWLGHADRLLEVTDLEGDETVSLSVEAAELCEGCPVIAWVIDENGALAETSWVVSFVDQVT